MYMTCIPTEPFCYIAKLGYAGVYLVFLFLIQNIDCGYTLDLTEAVITCAHNLFSAKIRKISIFFLMNQLKQANSDNLCPSP